MTPLTIKQAIEHEKDEIADAVWNIQHAEAQRRPNMQLVEECRIISYCEQFMLPPSAIRELEGYLHEKLRY